jgi:hypothetical protein
MRSPEIVCPPPGAPVVILSWTDSKRPVRLTVKLESPKIGVRPAVTFPAAWRYNRVLTAGKDCGHGLDHPDPRRNLHRPRNQRLSAAGILSIALIWIKKRSAWAA